jgi:uncharacterized glyoxalase superfamily protein PhnB
MGQITPYLTYRDVAAAIEWLARVYGFTETLRYAEPDGRISHAEMLAPDGGVVMLGSTGTQESTGAANAFFVVDVSDVQAHHDRVISHGATIFKQLADLPYGIRSYSTVDLEGFRWDFHQRIKDVAAEEWGAVPAAS